MDDLARQLVEAGAFRWQAGMLASTGRLDERVEVRSQWSAHGDAYPDLTDPATAALLAVQAMERGAAFGPSSVGGWSWGVPNWTVARDAGGVCRTLGEAVARALLALHGGV